MPSKFGKLSTSLPYTEEWVKGKGVGCIASHGIKKGDLVLRESPQLYLADKIANMNLVQQTESILKAFLGMATEDQDRYMRLHDIYNADYTE